MNMEKCIKDVFKVFCEDETLLRLLYYKPTSGIDDPLSTDKPNVLELDEEDLWIFINDSIKTTPKVDGLDTVSKCRILVYPGNRRSNGNYLIANQNIIIDVLVHFDFDEKDLRLCKICDRVNDLLFYERITGLGKITYDDGRPISAPINYIGYRLTYNVGDANKGFK